MQVPKILQGNKGFSTRFDGYQIEMSYSCFLAQPQRPACNLSRFTLGGKRYVHQYSHWLQYSFHSDI